MMNPSNSSTGRQRWLNQVAPIVILLVAIAIPIVMYNLKPEPPIAEATDKTPIVVTSAVMPAPASFDIETTGTVVPKREVTVGAEVAGKVLTRSTECEAGTFVKAGTPLIEIDSSKYQLQLQQLESELAQAKVDLLELDIQKQENESLIAIWEENLAITERELDRLERLARNASASQSEIDQQSSKLMQDRNALQQQVSRRDLLRQRKEKFAAQIELIEARIELARLDLERTKVPAPIDGYITEAMIEASAYVQPGTPLFRIEDRSSVEVRCNLKVDDLYWLAGSAGGAVDEAGRVQKMYRAPRVPATVSYRVAGETHRWTECFLSRYEGTGLDEWTRTIPCRIEVPSPDSQRAADEVPTLVRGMFVTVSLLATPRQPLVQIPYAALRPNNEVWIVKGDTLQIVEVRVAKMLKDSVLVHADVEQLQPGRDIVVSPLSIAVNEMKIRRAPAKESPTAVAGPSDEEPAKPVAKGKDDTRAQAPSADSTRPTATNRDVSSG